MSQSPIRASGAHGVRSRGGIAVRLATVIALCGVVMLSLGIFDGVEPDASAAPDSTPSPSTDAAVRTDIERLADAPAAAGRNGSELRLHGVILTGAPGEGIAMISVGQGAARTVTRGATVTAGMVLQSIAPDRVAIGPPGGPAAVVLMNVQALAATTQQAGPAFATESAVPSGMATGGETESSVQGNTGASSVIHPRRSRLHGIAVPR